MITILNQAFYQIYEMHPDADVYLHLGDSEFAYDDTELSLFNRVKGNCDFYPEFENEAVAKYNDVKAFYPWTFISSQSNKRFIS